MERSFTLTEEHLDEAMVLRYQKPLCESCPLALMFKENFKTDNVITVYSYSVVEGKDINHTEEMQDVICKFDGKQYRELKNMLPLTFTLDI